MIFHDQQETQSESRFCRDAQRTAAEWIVYYAGIYLSECCRVAFRRCTDKNVAAAFVFTRCTSYITHGRCFSTCRRNDGINNILRRAGETRGIT